MKCRYNDCYNNRFNYRDDCNYHSYGYCCNDRYDDRFDGQHEDRQLEDDRYDGRYDEKYDYRFDKCRARRHCCCGYGF